MTEHEEVAVPQRRRWIRPLLVLAVVATVVVVALLAANRPDEPSAGSIPEELSFGEVVVTDLAQIETYDATLGSLDGDPVTSLLGGTITFAPEAGATVTQGDVLFRVDGDPVVLMYGAVPSYRPLAIGEDTTTVTGRIPGTVTEVVAVGTALAQGDVLYRVDGEPVVILQGSIPAYRPLFDAPTNLEGDDVEQLEAALVSLGYDPDGTVTVDEEFTGNTADMVERWQEDIGATVDGRVELGEVVFLAEPGQVRTIAAVGDSAAGPIATLITGDQLTGSDVRQLQAALRDLGFDPGDSNGVFSDRTREAVIAWQSAVGMAEDGVVDLGEILFRDDEIRVTDVLSPIGSTIAPGTPILAVTSPDKVVRLNLPARDQGIVSVGDEVIVVMPDFSETAGVVQSVATTASIDQTNQAVFEVIIELIDPSVAEGLDEAPVDVEVVSDSVEGVLAVPVSSLIALSEGGYAVRVAQPDGDPRLVAVEPGFFAEGMVEISSEGVEPGDLVVVP